MSFGIIIRGKNQPSKSQRFHAHYSQALGKMVHTKDDYLREVKKAGLIPQKEAEKIAESKRREMDKPYKTSAWARDMVKEIKRTDGKVGGAFYDQLAKKGYDLKKINSSKNKKRADQISKTGDFT